MLYLLLYLYWAIEITFIITPLFSAWADVLAIDISWGWSRGQRLSGLSCIHWCFIYADADCFSLFIIALWGCYTLRYYIYFHYLLHYCLRLHGHYLRFHYFAFYIILFIFIVIFITFWHIDILIKNSHLFLLFSFINIYLYIFILIHLLNISHYITLMISLHYITLLTLIEYYLATEYIIWQ